MHDGFQSFLRRLVIGDQILDALLQAACPAGASALGADQPAPQFHRLDRRQMRGEGTVRRIEHMMSLVEHIAGRQCAIVDPAKRRLDHHQRMVGDNDFRPARPAHGFLDVAFGIMRAGGIDALATPVRQPDRAPPSEQIRQPGREITALHVPVPRHLRPARHQAQRGAELRHGRQGVHRLFQIE